MRRLLLVAFGFGLVFSASGQATYTLQLSGAWNNASNWTVTSGADVPADGIPDADDNVIIPNTLRVDITTSVACLAITLNGSGQIDFNTNNRTLTVNGLMTMNGTSSVLGGNNNRILNLQGDFIVPAGQTASMGGVQIAQNAARAFTVDGTFIPTSNIGTKNIANVVLNRGGLWSATSNENYSTINFTAFEGSEITGSTTSTITVNGNLVVNTSAPAGAQFRVGQISLVVNGATTVNGFWQFTASNAGTKRFENTITVNPGATWDNVIGEDPVVNCNIVNNGLWPIPTGGNGRYDVNDGGSYTYSGATEIGMTRLRLQNASTVTNLGQLVVTRNGNQGLSVETASTFINGTGGYFRLVSNADPIDVVGVGSSVNFTAPNNIVDYDFVGTQTVEPTTYDQLIISSGGTKSVVGLTTVNNSVTIEGTTILDVGPNILDGVANLIMTGTSQLRLQRTGVGVVLPELTGVTNSLAAGTTIDFYGAGPFQPRSSAALPYQNLTISGSTGSNADFSQVANILGNLVITNAGVMSSNVALNIDGTWTYNAASASTLSANVTASNFIFSNGVLNTGASRVIIDGDDGTLTNNGAGSLTAANVEFQSGLNQKITGTANTVLNNLIINNPNGVTVESLAGSPSVTVNGNLSFPDGNLITAVNNVVIMGAASTVTPLPGFVEGSLNKQVVAGSPTVTFEVGSGAEYSPLQLTFNTVSVAGSFTVSSSTPDHPDIAGSLIEVNATVNRFWSATNNAVTFTDVSATFNFQDADKDGAFAPLASTTVIKGYNNSTLTWFEPTMGARNANSTQCLGLTPITLATTIRIDFVIGGEIDPTFVFNKVNTGNWHSASTWLQYRTGVAVFTEGQTTVTGTSTLFTSELVVGDRINSVSNPTDPVMIVASIGSNTSLTLTAPYSGPYNGGVAPNRTFTGNIGREYVPNTPVSPTESVFIGNPNMVDAITTITLDNNATILELSIGSAKAQAHTLVHSGTFALNVQANAVVEQPTGNTNHTWDILDGTATVGGNLSLGGFTNNSARIARVRIQNGVLNSNNVVFRTPGAGGGATSAVATMDMSLGNGTWNLTGNLSFPTGNKGTLTSNTGAVGSTVNYNRTAGGQNLTYPGTNPASFAYHNVRCNNTTPGFGVRVLNNITTGGPNILTGNLAVESGLLRIGNNTITGGGTKTFSVSPGATFRMFGNQGLPGGFGTYSLGTTAPFGTVQFATTNNQTVPQIVSGYGNLEILGSANQNYTLANALVTVQGNLTIGNGTTTPDLLGGGGGTRLDLNGNLIVNTGATLNATDFSNSFPTNTAIELTGNWTNNSIVGFTEDDAAVTFNGTGTQTIGGTTSETFYRVVLNTPGVVQLQNNTTVSNIIRLTQGQLDLNNRTLIVTDNAIGAITRTGGDTGYIRSESENGIVRWSTSTNTGNYVVPFGKSSGEFIPFGFDITVGGSPAAGSMSFSTYGTATGNTPLPSGVTNLNGTSGGTSVVDRFWIITANNYTGTRPTANITFTATDAEISTTAFSPETALTVYNGTPPGLAAQRWSPSNYWDMAATPQTFTPNSPAANTAQVVINGVSSFSPWTLVDQSAPLPVELLSFGASFADGDVSLRWVTSSELNNDFFSIERSESGEKFSEIARVPGAGTTNLAQRYTVIDESPLPGVSYYRLKQTDYDGKYSYSQVVRVEVDGAGIWAVTPNPNAGEDFNVVFGNSLRQPVSVQVRDVSGRLVYQGEFSSGSAVLELELEQKLPAGVYIVTVTTENRLDHQRMVVK